MTHEAAQLLIALAPRGVIPVPGGEIPTPGDGSPAPMALLAPKLGSPSSQAWLSQLPSLALLGWYLTLEMGIQTLKIDILTLKIGT